MKSLKWEGFVMKNLFSYISNVYPMHGMQTRSSDETVRLSNACTVTKRNKNLSRFFITYEVSFSLVF